MQIEEKVIQGTLKCRAEIIPIAISQARNRKYVLVFLPLILIGVMGYTT